MDITVEAAWQRLVAGGWVSLVLVVLLVLLGAAVVNRQRRVRDLGRRFHGSRVRGGYIAEALAPLLDRRLFRSDPVLAPSVRQTVPPQERGGVRLTLGP